MREASLGFLGILVGAHFGGLFEDALLVEAGEQGVADPKGKRMGHAGAIVEGKSGTAQAKKEALKAAGAFSSWERMELPLGGAAIPTAR